MTLRERLQTETTAAMRSGDTLRRDVLRMAQNAIYNAEKAKRQPLSDDELRALVEEAIAATGAATPRDLGKVMGWLSPRTRNRADGKVVSGLVAQALAQRDLVAHDTRHG